MEKKKEEVPKSEAEKAQDINEEAQEMEKEDGG
jgi:hypothetical protein